MGKKICILLCLVIALSVVLPMQTTAGQVQNDVSISPLWAHIHLFNATLSFDNGRASMTGRLFAQPGTSSIAVEAVLERINANGTTTQVSSWSNLGTNSATWMWNESTTVIRGFNYRLTLTATVTRNGTSETATQSMTAWAS